jgi:hypothetical protein
MENITDKMMEFLNIPSNEEIMKAIHTEKPIELKDGFENGIMDEKFISGFLTGVSWIIRKVNKNVTVNP